MKLYLFKVNSNFRIRKKGAAINFERIIFTSFIISLTMLVIVQAALTNSAVRTVLSAGSNFEGVPLGTEEFLYKEGEINLGISSESGNENLKVLLNGEEVAKFTGNKVSLKVKDGDVIEVDASDVPDTVEVVVLAKSSNINTDCVGKRTYVKSAIKRLLRVEIN